MSAPPCVDPNHGPATHIIRRRLDPTDPAYLCAACVARYETIRNGSTTIPIPEPLEQETDPMTAGRRIPYVGEAGDGCRRSAQVDREEADTLDELNPRRETLAMSALAWELQAELEDSARVQVGDLAGMWVEPGVSAFDGLPFCRVAARFAGGGSAVGQITPAEARKAALSILEMAAAAEFDAALFAMLIEQGTTKESAAVALGELRATRVEHNAVLDFRDEVERTTPDVAGER